MSSEDPSVEVGLSKRLNAVVPPRQQTTLLHRLAERTC